jgi:hypothetical protein
MPFRFPTDLRFLTLGPCESLRRLRKLTMGLEQDSPSFPSSSSTFVSVVLNQWPVQERRQKQAIE